MSGVQVAWSALMDLFPRPFDSESRESLNRIAIFLYLAVTPVFNITLALLTDQGGRPFVAVTTALCLAGLAWLAAVPLGWRGRWIFPVAIVPVACCGLAAVASGPTDLIFVATLTAPLAWSAMLFGFGTTAVTFATTLVTFAGVVAFKSGPGAAVLGAVVLGVIEFLVGWVVYGKGTTLRQAQLESLERQLNDVEITLDKTGRVVFSNAVAQAAYGWSAEEFRARNIADLRLPDDLSSFHRQFDTVVSSGHVRFETVHRRRDGSTFAVAVNARAFSTQGRTFIHSLIRDITAEKAAREALDELNARLARKNADKGRLLALLGHDLGNSLGAFSQLLKLTEGPKGLSQEEFFGEVLPLLKVTADSSRAMLQDILAWMRSNSELGGVPQNYTTRGVAEAAVAAAQGRAHAKGVELAVHIAVDSPCSGNPAAVGAVLRNLLQNAIKYSEPGAAVAVTATQHEGRPALTVEDQGQGIEPERLATLFELAANKSTPGTAGEHGNGLGLWLSHEIATNLGGTLTAESTVGRGSVLRLTL